MVMSLKAKVLLHNFMKLLIVIWLIKNIVDFWKIIKRLISIIEY
jgi:hypothetical protein